MFWPILTVFGTTHHSNCVNCSQLMKLTCNSQYTSLPWPNECTVACKDEHVLSACQDQQVTFAGGMFTPLKL
jgi:hypothetical protein